MRFIARSRFLRKYVHVNRIHNQFIHAFSTAVETPTLLNDCGWVTIFIHLQQSFLILGLLWCFPFTMILLFNLKRTERAIQVDDNCKAILAVLWQDSASKWFFLFPANSPSCFHHVLKTNWCVILSLSHHIYFNQSRWWTSECWQELSK